MEITRLRFQDLLGESGDENARLTQGQMLLLGLNGLFEKMESNLMKFADQLKNLTALDVHLDFVEDIFKKMVMIQLFLKKKIIIRNSHTV